MEQLLVFVACYVGYFLLRAAFRDATSPEESTRRASSGLNAPRGQLEVRVLREEVPLDERTLEVFRVEVRGRLSERVEHAAVLVTSLFDVTDGSPQTVLCSLDDQQEERTYAFQFRRPVGRVRPGTGATDWVRVVTIIPETLIAAQSGQRTIATVVRVLPEHAVPGIRHGYHDNETDWLAFAEQRTVMRLVERGYVEAREQHEEAQSIILQAAVSMAAMENGIERAEAERIREWMQVQVEKADDDDREVVKGRLNGVLKEAFAAAEAGSLSFEPLVRKLASFNLPSANRQLLDLLTEVAGADSELGSGELGMLRSVGDILGITESEVKALTEARFLDSGVQIASQATGEQVLGIEPSWSPDQVRTHLRKEFAKWNGRIQALSTPEERDKAQAMIDMIAELRKKYA